MMTSETVDPNMQSQRKRDQEIDARYGAIGIAAVAAAARYQSTRYQSIGRAKVPAGRRDNDEQGT